MQSLEHMSRRSFFASGFREKLVIVFLPVLVGLVIYWAADLGYMFAFVRNYLPDVLWSLSLGWVLLWIWDGKVPALWWFIAGVMCLGFELMQLIDWVPGTGDIVDVIMYFGGLFLSWISRVVIVRWR